MALEVGVFEGRATVWMLENVLTDEGSAIICIDTFRGGEEHEELKLNSESIRNAFFENTKPHSSKVTLLDGRSDFFIPLLNGFAFDLVYIDGSHRAHDVLMDACLSWPLIVHGGFLIFDDYAWNKYEDETRNPKLGIDAFLSVVADRAKVLHKDYQLICRKV